MKTASFKIFFLTFIQLSLCTVVSAQTDTSWNQLPSILQRIQTPVFPTATFNILSYGASTDGVSLSTNAINSAITACNQAGGGKVIVPPGTFVTGAIRLKSNVNLYISKGATLKFSTNTADYLPVVLTRFEGVECYNYSPFIYALNAQNIAITGSGTLNGQASNANWWGWKSTGAGDVSTLNTMGENGTPVEQRIFGSGHKLRPNFIQPYQCKNILIDSITILNSPMWEIHPVLCENVTVRNVTVNSHGPNNDGCNPECSKDVLIFNCLFDTGDDCIAIKSGRNNDGRRVNVPSENIVIRQCSMKDGHGGVTMESECSGGIRNVFAEDCSFNSANLDRVLRIKTNSVRGGIIENIFMRNCTIGQVASEVIQIDMQYQEGDAGSFTPIVRNIEMKNVTGTNCPQIFDFNCYQRSPASNIKLIDCSFSGVTGNTLVNVEKLQLYSTFSNGTVPLIPAPAAGSVHAESYADKSDWGWSNVKTGFSGNGYMEPVTDSNFIQWTADASDHRMDTIVWTYANPFTTTKKCSLLVNGQFASQITFASTASSWKTIKTPFDALKGSNELTLVSEENTSIYLDKLTIKAGSKIITVIAVPQTEDKRLTCIPSLVEEGCDISITLPDEDYIYLDLLTAEGKELHTIYRGTCLQKTLHFTPVSLSQGCYLLRLTTSGFSTVQKIFLSH